MKPILRAGPVTLSVDDIRKTADSLVEDLRRDVERFIENAELRQNALHEAQKAISQKQGVILLLRALERLANAPYMQIRREREERAESVRLHVARVKERAGVK